MSFRFAFDASPHGAVRSVEWCRLRGREEGHVGVEAGEGGGGGRVRS